MTELRTPRLLLRRARPSDVGAIHVVMSDRETMRYWSTGPHPDVETTRRWMASMLEASPDGDELVIEHRGEVVGKVGCYRLPELGFILRRDLWGRGLMSEAASAMVAHLFATHDVPELRADVDPRNAASLRVLGRLGFVETGRAERTWCVDGVWADSVYLTLQRGAR